jgi:tripartite-type tricarboxylate transporter receptor subunit TctC
LIALHNAGNIRLLAVTSARRNGGAPDIETAVEAGLPGMVAVNFAGIFAPAGTPDAIIDQLAAASRKAMADPELRDLFDKAGLEVSVEDTPAKAAKFIDEEIARWTPVIRSINLKAQ